MTDKAHSLLTGSDLHEPKGADSASADTVYVADGSGSGTWKKVDKSQLTGTGNSFGGQLLHTQERYASGTYGETPSTTNFFTRQLNYTPTNDLSIGLSGRELVMTAGTYWCQAFITMGNSGRSQARLLNVTDNTMLAISQSVYFGQNDSILMTSGTLCMFGRFTLTDTKNVALQTSCSFSAAPMGIPRSSGLSEVYADLMIWKI